MKKYDGAIAILENYLDGAIADYENGDLDNTELISSSIKAIKLLQYNQGDSLCMIYNEYENRYLKALKK